VSYVKETGFTHIEFIPIMVSIIILRAINWWVILLQLRFGTPQDFMFLVDALHQASIWRF
jgi:1,4-alpha-glucan branching enzyme